MQTINELQLAKELIRYPSITPIDAGVMKFLEKQLRKLSEWSGKRILIAFFPGAYTGVCDDELCTLDEFRDLEDLNVEILGITVDSPFVLKNWKKQTNTNITLLSDFNYELIVCICINIRYKLYS